MNQRSNQPHRQKTKHLYGLGLDNHDGHTRLTRAEKFSIIGGSQETHERMTGTLVKTFEELDKKGLQFENTHSKQLAEIISKCADSL